MAHELPAAPHATDALASHRSAVNGHVAYQNLAG